MADPNIVFTFDIETLSLNPDGVILSLGVVGFDLTRVQSFDELLSQGANMYFDQKEQKARGRSISEDTVKWWSEQGDSAKECLDNPNQFSGTRLFEALNMLYERIGFFPNLKKTRWFSRGYFDIAFMDSFCKSHDIDPMIKYYTWRDVRSFLDGAGIGSKNQKLKKPANMVPHNSMHDAAFDAYMIQRLLNWTPEQVKAELEGK